MLRKQGLPALSGTSCRYLKSASKNSALFRLAGSAVAAGVVDMELADLIQGMLMSHLVVVNEAALNMYRLAWLLNVLLIDGQGPCAKI